MFDTRQTIKVEVPFVLVHHNEAWAWLKENCKGACYPSRKYVEFDNEQDAILFALRWKY